MAMRGDYSDTELVELLAKSTRTRQEAHERIYARYGKRVLGVCLAYEHAQTPGGGTVGRADGAVELGAGAAADRADAFAPGDSGRHCYLDSASDLAGQLVDGR